MPPLMSSVALAGRTGPKPRTRKGLFDTLTEAEAWLVGLIWADGYLYSQKRVNSYRVSLSLVDLQAIEAAAEIIGAPINRLPPRKPHHRPQFRVTFGDPDAVAALRSLGLAERKSLVAELPGLPSHLMRHFVRGYFDGDGSVGIYPGSSGIPRMESSFCGAWPLIESLREVLAGIGVSRKKVLGMNAGRSAFYRLRLNDSLRLADYMYRDGGPRLERKHQVFVEGGYVPVDSVRSAI